MVQRLKALTTPGDLGSVPSTHMLVHNHPSPPKVSTLSSDLGRHQAHKLCIYIHTSKHIG